MSTNRKSQDPTTQQARRRKVAAVLAGGLVLGVGTMATLASWNDSEFANATFTAGRFNLEGSLNGTAFTDHLGTVPAPTAGLSFAAPFNNLQPGSETYAGFAVRLAANTTNDAKVDIAASASGAVDGLKYQLVKGMTSTTCAKATFDAAAATSTNILVASSAVGTVTNPVSFDLTKGSPTSSPGGTVFLCIKVSADAGMIQGQVGTGTWEFQAGSKTT